MPVALTFEASPAHHVTSEMVDEIRRQAIRLPGAYAGCASWVADVISDACAILPSLLASRPELPSADRIKLAVHTAWVESIRRLRLRPDVDRPEAWEHRPHQPATPSEDQLPGRWIELPPVTELAPPPRPVPPDGYVAVARLPQPGQTTLHPVLRLALAWARLTPRERTVLEATMDVQPDLPTDHQRNDHNAFRPRTGQVLVLLTPRANPRSRRPVARLGEEQRAAYRAFRAALAEVDAEVGDEAA
jgi:hypothetical protein